MAENQGPTDTAIREFKDTYAAEKRYRNRSKRDRMLAKQEWKRMLEEALEEDLEE